MVLAAEETKLSKFIDFRGAVDRTAEAYCRLCGRVIFEMHADSIPDGLRKAHEHLTKFHGLLLKAI
jgi:hypothetical protein